MNLLSRFRIPYSEDKVFGFILMSLIIVSLGTIPAFSDGYDFPRLILWSVVIGLSSLFWVTKKKFFTVLPRSMIFAMGAMLVLSLVATVFSFDRINSLFGVENRMTSSLWFFSLWLVTIFLVSTLEKSKLFVFLKAWMIIGALMSLFGILQLFGFGFYEGVEHPVRALVPSFLGNPNFAGMYTAVTVFISTLFLYSSQYSNRFRIFALLCVGLNIFSLMIFASRGAIIGTLVGLGILFIGYTLKKKWKAVLGILAIVLALSVISYLYLYTVREQTSSVGGSDHSAQQRWYIWDDAFQNIAKHPLTGTGLGNYFIAFRMNPASYFASNEWFDDAHNIFLHIAVSGGVPFVLAFISLLGLSIWYLYQRYRYTEDDFPLYILAALSAWVVAGLFNPVTVANWYLLAILIALSVAHFPQRNLQLNRSKQNTAVSYGLVLMLLGSIFFLSSAALYLSDQSFIFSSSTSIKLNKLAVYINPTNTGAINSLAQKQLDDRQYDQSYKSYLKLEHSHLKSALILQQAATGYLKLYENTREEKYKQEVERIIPDILYYFNTNSFTHYNMAVFYLGLSDYDKALIEAREAIVRSNGEYGYWRLLSEVYNQMGQQEKKKKALQSAYKVSPSIDLLEEINAIK